MNKLKLKMFLFCIITYVALVNAGTIISRATETPYLGSIPLLLIFLVSLLAYIKRQALSKEIGLQKIGSADIKGSLFYLPLLVLILLNGVFFINRTLTAQDIMLAVGFMFLVTSLEEIICRGILLKVIDGGQITKRAVLISGATFGFGHTLSLLSGYDITQTVLQIALAVPVGIVLCLLFARTKSIVPGIVFHFLFNSASVLGALSTQGTDHTSYNNIARGIMILISIAYLFYLWKINFSFELPQENGRS